MAMVPSLASGFAAGAPLGPLLGSGSRVEGDGSRVESLRFKVRGQGSGYRFRV